ncbi:MAG TPA: hypothetical protein VFC25_07090 [Verrucomicrobiae bacterium]|nr:hypothetical protein [Verrucomicrobiae bacterium]
MRPLPLLLAAMLLFPALAIAAPVRIIATDKGFDAPETIPAGMRHVVFENHGTKVHEVMFVKLAEGMSADDYAAQVKNDVLFPKGALDYSGVGLTSPGEGTDLWVHLDAGEYVLICWDDSRSSIRPLRVNATSAKDDPPPKEDVTLRLTDFQFELDRPIRKGVQVIRIEAAGPSLHEADIFRLHPGKSAADVRHWYKVDEMKSPAPAVALGGILDSHDTHRVVWIRKTFSPGRYVLHCAIPLEGQDARSGEHHTIHADAGMVKTFEIE